ncbi:hypothetical protein T08_853 [Trichinella sp. T8]|nr:hypothetical protein T08_853 [Trichinella sp. T8]
MCQMQHSSLPLLPYGNMTETADNFIKTNYYSKITLKSVI